MKNVRYWVDAALEANWEDHSFGPGDQTGPFKSARALALVLIAMHDAHAAAAGTGTPYRVATPAPAGTKPDIAMAAAAYKVLGTLYPSQQGDLADAWNWFVAGAAPHAASIGFGRAVADAVLAWRRGDAPFLPDLPMPPPPAEPYDHGVDPLHPGQGFQGPLWGGAPPFLVALQNLDPLPGGGDPGGAFTPGPYYVAEFQEVLDYGAETSTSRTAEQEEIGIFWGYDGAKGLGTPPRLYMQVSLTVLDGFAARHVHWLTTSRYLQAVTAIAVAMADAGIQAWHYKYSTPHMLWRPVLGIRNAPPGVAGAEADPFWRPLGAPQTNQTDLARLATTPNFPSYPSGHATFGAASFEVLRRFIRHHDKSQTFTDGEEDRIGFTFTSDEFDGRNTDLRTGRPRPRVARTYRSLWQAMVENAESRVWLGVHWRMDGISRLVGGMPQTGRPASPAELGPYGGVKLGMEIAKVLATERGFA
jgi:hypothetical protein